jgi:GT2 family glycosyltransferase
VVEGKKLSYTNHIGHSEASRHRVLADITPVILTYNEAANIGRSLERLRWARRVVVVDSGSTDDTLAIVAGFPNVHVVHRPFDTHAQQWRFAVEETDIDTEWVLRLDADYMVEPAVRDEIAALAPSSSTAAYRVSFIYCIEGRPLRASLYPAIPALFRRGRGRFKQDGHTEKLQIDGTIGDLRHRILHDDRKTLERWLQSQARYQAQEAEKIATLRWSELNWPGRIRRTRFLGPPVVALHCLLVKRLAFDGSAGLLYTAQRVTAELILSMYLLRRDLDRLLAAKAAE